MGSAVWWRVTTTTLLSVSISSTNADNKPTFLAIYICIFKATKQILFTLDINY